MDFYILGFWLACVVGLIISFILIILVLSKIWNTFHPYDKAKCEAIGVKILTLVSLQKEIAKEVSTCGKYELQALKKRWGSNTVKLFS